MDHRLEFLGNTAFLPLNIVCFILVNKVYTDEMLHYAASHLVLQCLSIFPFNQFQYKISCPWYMYLMPLKNPSLNHYKHAILFHASIYISIFATNAEEKAEQ